MRDGRLRLAEGLENYTNYMLLVGDTLAVLLDLVAVGEFLGGKEAGFFELRQIAARIVVALD